MNVPEVWNFFSYCPGSMKRGEFPGKRTITEWPNFNMKPVAAQDQCSLKNGKSDDWIELTARARRTTMQRSEISGQKGGRMTYQCYAETQDHLAFDL